MERRAGGGVPVPGGCSSPAKPGDGSRRSPSRRRPVNTSAPPTAAAFIWAFGRTDEGDDEGSRQVRAPTSLGYAVSVKNSSAA